MALVYETVVVDRESRKLLVPPVDPLPEPVVDVLNADVTPEEDPVEPVPELPEPEVKPAEPAVEELPLYFDISAAISESSPCFAA